MVEREREREKKGRGGGGKEGEVAGNTATRRLAASTSGELMGRRKWGEKKDALLEKRDEDARGYRFERVTR